MREKKTKFIIVRVTATEKESLQNMALKAKERFSNFIRRTLGLD